MNKGNKFKNKYLRKQNTYKNPFYQNKKKTKKPKISIPKINWRFKLFILEILILLGGLTWFFYFSPVFEIVSAKVIGSQRIAGQEVESVIFDQKNEVKFIFWDQKNIFFFDLAELKNLLNKLYYLEEINIAKKLPGQIIVNLREKDYAAIWHEAGKYYYIGEEGRIIEEADPENIKPNYPMIDKKEGNSVTGKKIIGEVERIKYALQLFKKFKNKRLNRIDEDAWFEAGNFILDSATSTVKMSIKTCVQKECQDGPLAYFNSQENIQRQVTKLLTLIKEKLKNDLVGKEYIDLRHGDRVYYR